MSAASRLRLVVVAAAALSALASAAACSSSSSPAGGAFDANDDAGAGASAIGVPHTADGGVAHECDPFDGAHGSCDDGSKCTYVQAGTSAFAACVAQEPPTDDAGLGDGLGAPCTGSAIGHDTCAAGFFCTSTGVASGSYCRALCRTDSECPGTNQRCATFTDGPPYYGICLSTCEAFSAACAAQSGTCGATIEDVDQSTVMLVCRSIGTKSLGSTCSDSSECADGYTCVAFVQGDGGVSNHVCAQQCNSSHPCSGTSCFYQPGSTYESGVCPP